MDYLQRRRARTHTIVPIVPILSAIQERLLTTGRKLHASVSTSFLFVIALNSGSCFFTVPAIAHDAPIPVTVKPLKNKNENEKVQNDKLPKLELTKETLFKLLSSDIAIQRGEWESAFVTLLGLAQETRDPRLAKKAAEVAMGAQQLNEALAAINLWRELNPDSFEASQYYLSLMVIKSDFQEIEHYFIAQTKKSSSTELPALLYQAQSLLARMQNKQFAFNTLEKIVENVDESVDSHIVLARGAYASGNRERSITEARLALLLQPTSELAVLSLAQALDKEEGFQMIRDFLKKNTNSHDVRLAYATMLIESRQLELAKNEFELILKNAERDKKSNAKIIFTLGSIELELNHTDAAEAYLQRYLNDADQDLNKNSAYINLAQVELQRKNTRMADAWLAKVDNVDDKTNTWFNIQMRRALLMASDQRYTEARQFLQGMKANNDAETALLLQTESQVMKAAGQHLEAFIVLEAALSDFPRHPDLLYDFAMLAESLKRYPEMEMALKQLISVSPENPFAYNALGYSYADRNVQLEEAGLLLNRAIELNPNDPYILDSFAWLKFRLKKFQEAEDILRRCLQLRRDPEIEIHLAEVLWNQEKRQEAAALLSDARKKDPSNELLKSTIERLGIQLP